MKRIDCTRAEPLIRRDLADQDLTSDERLVLEAHLEQCPPCARAREEYQTILSAIATDVPVDPGEEYWGRLQTSLTARLQERASHRATRWSFGWKLTTAAGAAALIVVALFLGTSHMKVVQPVDRTAQASELMQELQQVLGPVADESGFAVAAGDQTSIAVGTSDVRLNGALVYWFEVEDESNLLFM